MKTRLTTLDIVSLIKELEESLLGLRVDQVYDIDRKTYLIRVSKTDVKKVLVLESGVRFHTTTFEWPKNPAPSGFTMKLRKHLSNKRVEKITQLGADRIVDFQFGSNEVAHHLLLELYDKGNIILTDYKYRILSLLRPRLQGEERLAAHETYAVEKAKQDFSLTQNEVVKFVEENPGKALREIFLSKVEFGPALFAHVLRKNEMAPSNKIPAAGDQANEFAGRLFKALEEGRLILEKFKPAGAFIVLSSGDKNKKKEEVKTETSNDNETQLFYDQFHPSVLLSDFQNVKTLEFPTLNEAVDDFFSKIESQKIDMQQINKEKDALKKLEKVKLDQMKRLEELKVGQEEDKRKAELISVNQHFIDAAIAAIRKLVASQISWDEIWEQIEEAKENQDVLACSIVKLNLIKNQFTMKLRDPYETPDDEPTTVLVDMDLSLSAYANATKYYDLKRQSARKEERTLESQDKALKSTAKKTMATLREVATIHSIKKARKVYWFEKFKWFVTSENYMVLVGRDAQQNELLVKRYMKPRDVYLHADAHGAPTVVIKNDSPEQPVLPKSLNEAGAFAVAMSGSWDSKIVTSSWWVWGDQVSKSAPTGEYLPTGSFMVRGKKNYLPQTQLVLGFGFLFKLSDECIEKHKNERQRRLPGAPSEENVPLEKHEKLEKPKAEPEEVESNSDSEQFPDTQVKLKLDGSVGRTRTQTLSTMSVSTEATYLTENTNYAEDESQNTFIISSGLAPLVVSAQKLKRDKKRADKKVQQQQQQGAEGAKGGKKGSKNEVKDKEPANNKKDDFNNEASGDNQLQKPKRGQHGRNKKLKEKYKDQDDEEREMRMLLLRGGESALKKAKAKKAANNSTPHPPSKKSQNIQDVKAAADDEDQKPKDSEESLQNEASLLNEGDRGHKPEETVKEEENDSAGDEVEDSEKKEGDEAAQQQPPEEEVEEVEEGTHEAERNILDSLTGAPKDDDELLFAIPVVAPYSTLQSYKFKIKMVPGTTKRGKAARSSLEFFLRDKSANQRQKDLLKSVKDQDLARNFPAKVKTSAGHDKR